MKKIVLLLMVLCFFGCKKEFAKAEQVKCDECKHWIDKSDAQKVIEEWGDYYSETYYFCPMHRRLYDRVNYLGFWKLIPEHYERVDSKGNIIKNDITVYVGMGVK